MKSTRTLIYISIPFVITASGVFVDSNLYCKYQDIFKKICSCEIDDHLCTLKQVNEVPSPLDNTFASKQTTVVKMNGLYRPRSALARALYEKHQNDMKLEDMDKEEWYRIDHSRLSPELQQKFVQLHPDDETREFLSSSVDKSSWVWTQIWYLLAKAVLKYFWTITDINGWLGRGSMFVLSEDQARKLLAAPLAAGAPASMVDVGAGDGEVARKFAPLFHTKYATEISASMRQALSSKGFVILDTEGWWKERRFTCVCMLNLLDRCQRPRSMLRQARAAISAEGVLLVALVLPYKPYVEVTADHQPEERLPIEGIHFEDQVASFVTFMSTMGFQLVSWSRVPYLSEGDFAQAYYFLDDSIYVFKPTQLLEDI